MNDYLYMNYHEELKDQNFAFLLFCQIFFDLEQKNYLGKTLKFDNLLWNWSKSRKKSFENYLLQVSHLSPKTKVILWGVKHDIVSFLSYSLEFIGSTRFPKTDSLIQFYLSSKIKILLFLSPNLGQVKIAY